MRWQVCEVSVATSLARWLVLRSALSWAVTQALLRSNPLAGVRGPPRPRPRLHHTLDEVHRMLTVAEADVATLSAALAADPASLRWRRLLLSSEQTLLLVRVATDSGARRGELAVRCRRWGADDRARRVPRRDRVDQDRTVAAFDPRRDDNLVDQVALVVVGGSGTGAGRRLAVCTHGS